jgi:hypothetical protein
MTVKFTTGDILKSSSDSALGVSQCQDIAALRSWLTEGAPGRIIHGSEDATSSFVSVRST